MIITSTNRAGLTAQTLKLFAIAAMLIDHIAWRFVPTATAQGILMHIAGRLTMPVMCFFIAEGFYHTRSKIKYALRLFMFALISQVPFTYQQSGHWLPVYQSMDDIIESVNVIFTLFLGLISLWACKSSLRTAVKSLIVAGCCILACASDWAFFGVLYVLAFGLNRGDFKRQVTWFSYVSIFMVGISLSMGLTQLFQAGVFLALPLLNLYNGKRGGFALSKWIFYVFYPLNLLILGMIRFL